MLLALLVTLFAVQIHSACIGSLSQPQYNSLETLFNSTSGESWVWSSSSANSSHWTFPSTLSDPCSLSWQGLNCSEISPGACNVQGLDLTGMNLQGSLPASSFIDLTAMVSLTLSQNHLTGTLSTLLGELTQIERLSLNKNSLRGFIPTEFSNLQSLSSLDFSLNSLSGSVPSQLGLCSSLSSLNLGFNRLIAQLPSDLARLEQLIILNIEHNKLSGPIPTDYGSLTRLEALELNDNQLQGPIPSEVGLLTSIQYLYLHNNRLSGQLPPELWTLYSMVELFLYTNKLSGPLSTNVGDMSSLIELVIDQNAFTGTIPITLSELSGLVSLDLSTNSFTGILPPQLGGAFPLCDFFGVFENYLTGTLPLSLSNLTLATQLYVNDNHFTGTVPEQYSRLTGLLTLDLAQNMLTGTLHSSFGLMTLVQTLELESNNFTGRIPTEWGLMVSVELFSLNNNELTGTIPTELGSLENVQYLELNSNKLTGGIPSELALLTNVVQIVLSSNRLSRTVPSELGSLPQMQLLSFYSNEITGFLPAQLGRLARLELLEGYDTQLSGPIPPQFGNLSSLVSLSIASCWLSGVLPPQLSALVRLKYLSVGGNMMAGPVTFGPAELLQLEFIDLSYNYFSGPLPFARVANWTDVNISSFLLAEIQNKSHDHPLPTSFVENIEVNSNFFTGVIPDNMWSTLLRSVNISANMLSGSLHSSLCSSAFLQSLSLRDAGLDGTLPSCLCDLQNLIQVDFSLNGFGGDLVDVFDSVSAYPSLQVLDLSSNGFTGTLPARMLELPSLQSLIVYSNCFHGSLPSTVCQGNNITELVLDGLTSAQQCLRHVVPALNGVFPKLLMSGSIPECVWSMPKLSLLHLAGNGFTGTLGELSPSSVLSDVNLASNRLIGTLPSSFQHYGGFVQLDVSSNRITGTLSSSFAVSPHQTLLNLTVNRLSGPLPYSFQYAPGMNVLEGNLYSCGSPLPQSDPYLEDYVCGAEDLNLALIVWLAVAGFLSILCIYLLHLRKFFHLMLPLEEEKIPELEAEQNVHQESSDSTEASQEAVTPAWDALQAASEERLADQLLADPRMRILTKVMRCSVFLGSLFSTAILLMYALMKSGSSATYYSSQTFQYTWLVSASFWHGYVPPIIITVILLCSISMISLSLRSAKPKKRHISAAHSIILDESRASVFKRYLRIFALHTFSIFVTLLVNIVYVYGVIKGMNASNLFAIQISLACFKVFWTNVAIPVMIKIMASSGKTISHRMFMVLFAYIGGPVVSIFFSESTCFLYVLTGQPPIDSTYHFSNFDCKFEIGSACLAGFESSIHCKALSGTVCAFGSEETLQSSVHPGWMYSYQCSSSLLTEYVPVLILSFLISGFIVPTVRLLYATIPNPSKPAKRKHYGAHSQSGIFELDSKYSDVRGTDIRRHKVTISINNANVVCRQFLNLTMILTFGLASPLFAVTVAIDAALQEGVIRLLTRRFVAQIRDIVGSDNDKDSMSISMTEFSNLPRLSTLSPMNAPDGPARDTSSGRDTAADQADTMSSSGSGQTNITVDLQFAVAKVKPERRRVQIYEVESALGLGVVYIGLFWSLFFLDMVGDMSGALSGGCCMLIPALGCPILFWLLNPSRMSFIYRPFLSVQDSLKRSFSVELGQRHGQRDSSKREPSLIFEPQATDNTFSVTRDESSETGSIEGTL